jgi:ribosomal protein S6--L-glutamate ligase
VNIGVIGLRGGWSTERLRDTLESRAAGGTIIELSDTGNDLEASSFSHRGIDLGEFDGFIVKKPGSTYSPYLVDQLDVLALLERKGLRFFSRPSALREVVSKLSCTLRLREHNIPMPPTFVTGSLDEALDWCAGRLPVIIKPLYGSKARGMILLDDESTLQKSLSDYFAKAEGVTYLQQKLDLAGSDYALAFLAGKYLGAYARVTDGTNWHTAVAAADKYRPFEPPEQFIELAHRAQDAFELDFACVDIANTDERGPVVFEVSAFGGYGGLYHGSGIDAAQLLADYVVGQLSS